MGNKLPTFEGQTGRSDDYVPLLPSYPNLILIILKENVKRSYSLDELSDIVKQIVKYHASITARAWKFDRKEFELALETCVEHGYIAEKWGKYELSNISNHKRV
jgi:hypothetical protein